VDGFILKDAPPAESAAAIRDVAQGRRAVDAKLTLAALDRGSAR
jgi:two-component system, NarL family, response regulator DesR